MEEKIIAIITDINEDVLDYDGENMLKDGVLNSFELVELIGELEEEFDIEIDAADIIPENVGNKAKLIAYITKLVG